MGKALGQTNILIDLPALVWPGELSHLEDPESILSTLCYTKLFLFKKGSVLLVHVVCANRRMISCKN